MKKMSIVLLEKIKICIDFLLWTMFLVLLTFRKILLTFLQFQENMVIIVFHVIVPSSQIWQKIISQTNIFNIFPASVPYNTVSKIIQSNYSK